MCAMNIKIENIEVAINGEPFLANLKWFRGASRYNNGGNHNGKLLKDKYPLRIIIGRLKERLKNRSFHKAQNCALAG
jgi:hypothetical protein